MRAKRKMIATMVAIVLVACTGLILIGNLSKGFQNMDPTEWQLREVNEENLYQQFSFIDIDGKLTDGSKGVYASIDDDHVIDIEGTAEEADAISVGEYTLKASTSYVFSSGFKGSTGTLYMRLIKEDGTVVANVYSGSVVIKASDLIADTKVSLEIVVAKEAEVDLKIKPVICLGTSAEDLVEFYK